MASELSMQVPRATVAEVCMSVKHGDVSPGASVGFSTVLQTIPVKTDTTRSTSSPPTTAGVTRTFLHGFL